MIAPPPPGTIIEGVTGAPTETSTLPSWWTKYSGFIFLGFALGTYAIGGTRLGTPIALFLLVAIIMAGNTAIQGKSSTS